MRVAIYGEGPKGVAFYCERSELSSAFNGPDFRYNICTYSRAAKNSDFVRVIGFFNPPLRVRTDIYAINDLFGLWTRYKIGINLNYSD